MNISPLRGWLDHQKTPQEILGSEGRDSRPGERILE
jgi:hypothetical protein